MKVVIGRNPMKIDGSLPELKKEFPGVEFIYAPKADDVMAQIADAEVYVGWPDRKQFQAAKKIKWVMVPGTGVDRVVAVPEIKNGDVILTSIRGAHGVAIAESALGMIFWYTRGLMEATRNQPKHVYTQQVIRDRMVELTGSTIGIIGLGSIGRALAKRAFAFDAKIIAVDAYPPAKPDFVHELWGLEKLDDLLRQSDYVVITVPGTPETAHMIGAREISLMKRTAMLVLVSRGGVLDEKALLAAVQEKRLAAAALDVFEQEPLAAVSPLWDAPNMLITPHIAGGTQFEGSFTIEVLRENLHRFLMGQLPLRNQIDKQKGF